MPTLLKDQLRSDLRARRAALDVDTRTAAAHAIITHTETLSFPADAVFGAYYPMGAELDTKPLMQHWHDTGRTIALPRTVAPTALLRFFIWQQNQPLEKDIFSFKGPSETTAEVWPDVIFVPLIGFDKHGNRLGQGQGHYDRTLHHMRARQNIVVIGLAYACQEVGILPAEPHDEKLDFIITEHGILRAHNSEAA